MRVLAVLLTSMLFLSACETLPRDAFRPTESSLATRNMQTRSYESMSDQEILSATSAVLQDMGYSIDEIEVPLGVVSASKRADASSTAEFMGAVLVDGVNCVITLMFNCNGRNVGEIGDVQDIHMTVVSRPTLENEDDVTVRVTIQQTVWDRNGQVSLKEVIRDEDVYSSFFEKMSKAVFLEREGL